MSAPLCRASDLEATGARGCAAPAALCEHGLFVVERAGRFYAYLNRCPHARLPLNWFPDRFLDAEGRYIQCANHDARFRVEDGLCVAGPCAGERLTAVAVRPVGGEIFPSPQD